jgi:hypothetical protein
VCVCPRARTNDEHTLVLYVSGDENSMVLQFSLEVRVGNWMSKNLNYLNMYRKMDVYPYEDYSIRSNYLEVNLVANG